MYREPWRYSLIQTLGQFACCRTRDQPAKSALRGRGTGYALWPHGVVPNVVAVREIVLAFAIYLVLVIALPVILSSLIGFRSLPRSASCPNCAQDTIPLLSYPLRYLRLVKSDFSLQHRWCPTCEWDGFVRGSASLVRVTDSLNHPREKVRTIEIGGRPWSVMLESWNERGRYYGRLLFVGPSGKLWCDPLAAFTGSTSHDVLEQALALSDRLLAYRLRDVISG